MRPRWLASACLVAAALSPAACSDPVRDRREAAVGPEDPSGPSADHRRGQDCLLCHDAEGGAKPEMAVAGTVFKDESSGAAGAENVEVEFFDASGGGPLFNPMTLSSGNFYIEKKDWPDLTFPFKVRLKTGGNTILMRSTANREASCNFCHRPNPPQPYTEQDRENARSGAGQIFVTAGGQ